MMNWFTRKIVLPPLVACLSLMLSACGNSGVNGTYQNDNGFAVLELRSGGNVAFNVGGEKAPCSSYTVDGNNVTLKCDDGDMLFTRHDDGSLTGPPGNFMGALRKTK